MNDFSVSISTYGNYERTIKTIESIEKNITKNIIVICDKTGFNQMGKMPCDLIRGVEHGKCFGAYRNQIIGIKNIYKKYNSKWIFHIEWDVQINNNDILKEIDDFWFAGFDIRKWKQKWKILNKKIDINVEESVYSLGCFHIYNNDFIKILEQKNILNEILSSGMFWKHEWADYKEYSADESILPSLCNAFGGKIKELGSWDKNINKEKYGVRYRPEWDSNEESLSVLHPLKS